MGIPTKLLVALALVATACTGGTPDTTSTSTETTSSTAAVTTTSGVVSTTSPSSTDPPDLILHNARLLTVDDAFTIAEAVAISDGIISGVGESDELLANAGSETIIVDLGGRTVSPGFVDPHTHLMQYVAPDLGAMRAGQQELLSWGVTTAGMPSVLPDQLGAFETLNASGEVALRAHLYLAYNSVCGERDLGDFYRHEYVRDASAHLAVAGVKVFSDGGVCGAPAVTTDYLDTTPQLLKDRGWTGTGTPFVTTVEVASVISEVDAAGGQTIVHATGDAAITTVLEAFRVVGDTTNSPQIHHNSLTTLVDPDLLTTYGDLGMIPVVFTLPFGNACDQSTAEVWRSIFAPSAFDALENRSAMTEANPGIRFAWHGDAPSIPGSPLDQMFTLADAGYADPNGHCYPEAWIDLPTVSVEEAFRMVTINAAAAMGFEDSIGSIEIGKLADLAILESDPLSDDRQTGLALNRPLATIIGGSVEYCLRDLCAILTGEAPVEETEVKTCLDLTTEGLIGWWPGENEANDVVGGNDGVLVDGATFGRGYVGGAFALSQGAVALSAQPSLSDGFTLNAWAKFNETGIDGFQTVFNNNQAFLRKNDATEGNGFALFINLADGSVEPRVQSTTPILPGEWTHVAGTWDGAELSIYVNGRLDATEARPGTLTDTVADAQIGRGEQQDLIAGPFDGAIDEFEIYERALAPAEIQAIFDAGNAGRCTG